MSDVRGYLEMLFLEGQVINSFSYVHKDGQAHAIHNKLLIDVILNEASEETQLMLVNVLSNTVDNSFDLNVFLGEMAKGYVEVAYMDNQSLI